MLLDPDLNILQQYKLFRNVYCFKNQIVLQILITFGEI